MRAAALKAVAAVTCAACVVLLGAAGCSALPSGAPASKPVVTPVLTPAAALTLPAGYQLVWADEFNTPGLPDPTRWVHDTGRNKEGWHNHELQYYSGPRAENAVVEDGKLVIAARRERLTQQADYGGQNYTAARLLTAGRAEWTYGYFEIRARMPCGKGSWPAIWTLGSKGDWPAGGELDILEHMGHTPQQVSSAVHTPAGSGGAAVSGRARLPSACSAMHNYQMLWTRDGVSFGVDGVVHWHYARRADEPAGWPFDQPQFLILNIAIGGDLGGPVDDSIFPLRMEVEHVRVYQAARP